MAHPRATSLAELGHRISQVLDLYPSRAEAARQTSISADTLWSWSKGANEPSLLKAGDLARRVGVDLNWLVSGNGEMMRRDGGPTPKPLDIELLTLVVGVVEDALAQRGRTLNAAQKGEAIATLYELASDQPEGERESWIRGPGAKVLRLVK